MLQLLPAVVTQLSWWGLKHGPPWIAILCIIIYETFNTITTDGLTLKFNPHRSLQKNMVEYNHMEVIEPMNDSFILHYIKQLIVQS